MMFELLRSRPFTFFITASILALSCRTTQKPIARTLEVENAGTGLAPEPVQKYVRYQVKNAGMVDKNWSYMFVKNANLAYKIKARMSDKEMVEFRKAVSEAGLVNENSFFSLANTGTSDAAQGVYSFVIANRVGNVLSLFVFYQGTNSTADWYRNLNSGLARLVSAPKDFGGIGLVKDGLYYSASQTRNFASQVSQKFDLSTIDTVAVTFAGHSAGGMLATLSGLAVMSSPSTMILEPFKLDRKNSDGTSVVKVVVSSYSHASGGSISAQSDLAKSYLQRQTLNIVKAIRPTNENNPIIKTVLGDQAFLGDIVSWVPNAFEYTVTENGIPVSDRPLKFTPSPVHWLTWSSDKQTAVLNSGDPLLYTKGFINLTGQQVDPNSESISKLVVGYYGAIKSLFTGETPLVITLPLAIWQALGIPEDYTAASEFSDLLRRLHGTSEYEAWLGIATLRLFYSPACIVSARPYVEDSYALSLGSGLEPVRCLTENECKANIMKRCENVYEQSLAVDRDQNRSGNGRLVKTVGQSADKLYQLDEELTVMANLKLRTSDPE